MKRIHTWFADHLGLASLGAPGVARAVTMRRSEILGTRSLMLDKHKRCAGKSMCRRTNEKLGSLVDVGWPQLPGAISQVHKCTRSRE